MLFSKDTIVYNGQLRKYAALVGSLFDGLHIARKVGERIDYVAVPIKYGAGYLLNKARKDYPNLKAGLVLPAMSFQLVTFVPDTVRHTATNIKIDSGVASGTNQPYHRNATKSPIPHDITYSLTIRTKNIEDAMQIIEQIIGAFNPQVTVQFIDNADVNVTRDITVKLEPSYDYADNYEDQMDDHRFVEIGLMLTVKGYIYKQIKSTPIVLNVAVEAIGENAILETWSTVPTQEEMQDYQTSNAYDGLVGLTAKATKT